MLNSTKTDLLKITYQHMYIEYDIKIKSYYNLILAYLYNKI